jgi:hypothetical protein
MRPNSETGVLSCWGKTEVRGDKAGGPAAWTSRAEGGLSVSWKGEQGRRDGLGAQGGDSGPQVSGLEARCRTGQPRRRQGRVRMGEL